jgi:hypothetical protein
VTREHFPEMRKEDGGVQVIASGREVEMGQSPCNNCLYSDAIRIASACPTTRGTVAHVQTKRRKRPDRTEGGMQKEPEKT